MPSDADRLLARQTLDDGLELSRSTQSIARLDILSESDGKSRQLLERRVLELARIDVDVLTALAAMDAGSTKVGMVSHEHKAAINDLAARIAQDSMPTAE